jgi:hypothetical protein
VACLDTALAVFAGAAPASGPAAPGKDVIRLMCVRLGDLTVSVPGKVIIKL